jgi:hypothetical protein
MDNSSFSQYGFLNYPWFFTTNDLVNKKPRGGNITDNQMYKYFTALLIGYTVLYFFILSIEEYIRNSETNTQRINITSVVFIILFLVLNMACIPGARRP